MAPPLHPRRPPGERPSSAQLRLSGFRRAPAAPTAPSTSVDVAAANATSTPRHKSSGRTSTVNRLVPVGPATTTSGFSAHEGTASPESSPRVQSLPDASGSAAIGVTSFPAAMVTDAASPFSPVSPTMAFGGYGLAAVAAEKALGMQAGKAGVMPEDLQTCEEGCYWRWLVHVLLEDLAGLKTNFETEQNSLAERKNHLRKLLDSRNQREELQKTHDRLEKELDILRVQVPRQREEREYLSAEIQRVRESKAELQGREVQLRDALGDVTGKCDKLRALVEAQEREAGGILGLEDSTNAQIAAAHRHLTRLASELTYLNSERDRLESQIASKKAVRKQGRAKRKATAQRK
eukprot:TRINITY_DN49543_c0_g1_i1.p1 TRINITY_DN49543_c0_g1~~TRINITY_DN49543_c0_g1_i1.p1  ORF type:complete len:349 (+),score=59.95 TRINITY_DN49543_c0_g1_i1:95-1141(+)